MAGFGKGAQGAKAFGFTRAFTDDIGGATPDEGAPSKPGIPLLLPCALGLWAAAASAYALLEAAGSQQAFAATVALGASAVAGLAAAAASRRRWALVAAFALAGAAIGALCAHGYHTDAESLPEGEQHLVVELSSDAKSASRGSYASARCTLDDGRTLGVTAFFDETQELYVGARLECSAELEAVSEEYSSRSYYSGAVAQLDVSGFERLPLFAPMQLVYDTRAKAIGVIAEHGGAQAGILQALVCGYRNTIQQNGEYDLYRICGLAHVVAVSGAHLAIVTMAFGWLLRMLRAGRRATLAASIVFVCAYLVFAGVPISAIRAAVMVVMSLLAGMAGRRNATLNSLAVCVIGFIVTDPVSCVSVSLFLSAGATLGIAMFAPLASSWLAGLPGPLAKVLGEPVGLTLSSNVMTLPYTMAAFEALPVLSVPANVVATPLFTAACVCGLACALASCAIPSMAPALIGAASLAAWPLSAAVSAIASLPNASVEVSLPVVPMIALSAALAFALWVAWPKLGSKALAAATAAAVLAYACSIVFAPRVSGDALVMLDVGQGDAFLLCSEGQTMLIDTGNEDEMLKDALASVGVRHVDAVAVTHPDSDHCASLPSLATYAGVGSFLCADPMLECGCSKCEGLLDDARAIVGEEGVKGLRVGDVIDVGKFRIEVVWPDSYSDKGGNADSLCMMAHLDCDDDGEADWRILFTGDAESAQLDEMLALGRLEDVDVLKVGHHGSKVALDEASMKALRPELALVSAGQGNSYGHPSKEALDALDGWGAQVLRTDEGGTVVVGFEKERLTVPRQSG